MSSVKYMFSYYIWNGRVMPQVWDLSIPNHLGAVGPKVELTEEEFMSQSLAQLMAKYPYDPSITEKEDGK